MVMQKCYGGAVLVPDQCNAKNENLLLNCATKAGAMEVLMPSIISLNWRWVDILVFDHENSAGKNNITIKPSEGNKINGSEEPIILKNNGAGAIFRIFGVNDWKCTQFE
jgi:hypothetical protein